MMRTVSELFSAALVSLGYSLNSTDRDEIAEAEQLLQAQKPFVLDYYYIDIDQDSVLVSGEAHAAMIYSGDALYLQDFHPSIEYIIPKEGGMLWLDEIVVMDNSPNKALAMEFINFLNEPKIAARLAEFVYYPTPNLSAEQYLSKEFLSNPAIYTSEEILAKFEFYQVTKLRSLKRRNEAVSKLLSN